MAPPAFVRAVAYGPYRDRMRAVIHALKYEGLQPAARPLGRLLAEAIATLAGEAPADLLVVPVPLHPGRYAERGFNQARLLAFHAVRSLRKTHPEMKLTLAQGVLSRRRSTESQASLTPRQRRNNLRGAFSVTRAQTVLGRDVLLIDDIFTTGATARAAALALRRAGAASVWVATLARAGKIFPRGAKALGIYSDSEDAGQAAVRRSAADETQPASMHSFDNQPSH